MFQHSFASETNTLRFQLRTRNRWVKGCFYSSHRRLIDVLNMEGSQLLKVEQASVAAQRDLEGGEEPAGFAAVSISSILFAVPLEEMAAPRPADPFAYVKKRPERIRACVGPYEILGNFFLVEGSEVQNAVNSMVGRFLAISQAAVTCLDDPQFSREYDVVFVNREHLEVLLPPPVAGLLE